LRGFSPAAAFLLVFFRGGGLFFLLAGFLRADYASFKRDL
jgi:hypothetical protein